MAITGDIFSWGSNEFGQLGDGTRDSTLLGVNSDDFEDATIDGFWTQEDKGSGGSFTEAASAGYLTITAGDGYCSATNFTPTWIYQIANEADFVVTCKMYFVDTINANYEQAGLVVALNDDSSGKQAVMRVIYNSTQTPTKYLDCSHFSEGSAINNNLGAVTSPIWMRVSRVDETITFEYSEDGIHYTEANPSSGNLLVTSDKLYIALFAAQNGSGNPFNVSFSDFEVTPVSGAGAAEAIGDLNFTDLAGGRNHSLGLNWDGKIYAWGDNSYGQLGDGTNISKSSPVAIQGNRNFLDISSSADHTMAIDVNGKLLGWGRNDYGQVGPAPPSGTAVEDLGDNGVVIEVSQEDSYPFLTLGQDNQAGGILERSTGQLWMWGLNTYGQLADGTTASQLSPVSVVGGHQFIDYAGGNNWGNIAMDVDGNIWVWGYNGAYRLGDGTTTNRSTPKAILTPPGGIKGMRPGTGYMCGNCGKQGTVGIGSGHAVFIGEDRTLYGWGDNNFGELGAGNKTSRTSPIALPLWGKVGHVVAEHNTTYAIRWSDELLGREEMPDWGYRIRGYQSRGVLLGAGLDVGNWTTAQISTPVLVCAPYEASPCSLGWTVTHVSRGHEHSCAADIGKSGGKIFCWGDNTYRQLGNLSSYHGTHPMAIAGPINVAEDWKDFSCGYRHTCALRASDGTAWCWGYNNYGQLGTNNRATYSSPKSVVGGKSFVAIACIHYGTVALDSDGLLWGWGESRYNFQTTSFSSPVSVGAVEGKSSPYFPADEVQYALGYLYNQASPIEIGNFVDAAAGLYHSLAIDRGGSVWAWGRNNKGQLGTGDTVNRSSPVAVSGLPAKKFVKVTAGALHSCALAEDGEIYCWGDNTYSQVTSSGIVSGDGGGSEITELSTGELILPDWYTTFDNYAEGAGIEYGTGTYTSGFFCKYQDFIDVNCPVLSNDWQHGEVWEAGQHGFKIINLVSEGGPSPKFGIKVARWKHSGSVEDVSIANRVVENVENQDILGLARVTGDESGHDFMGIAARIQDQSAGNETMYRYSFNHSGDGGSRMMKQVNGAFTQLGQSTVPAFTSWCNQNPGQFRCPGFNEETQTFVAYNGYTWRNNDWMWIRFKLVGTTLKGVIWPYGYPMPTNPDGEPLWDIVVEDSDITGGGSWGFSASWGQLADTSGFWEWFGVKTGGDDIIVTSLTETTTTSGYKAPTFNSIGNYIDIDAGGYHNIVLDDNFRAWTWGRNDYGQLGVNDLDERSTPTSVYGDHRFYDISAGEFHTYALKPDGTICTWGAGDYGKLLHHGDQSPRSFPHCGVAVQEVACVDQLPDTGNYEHATLLRCSNSWEAWTWGCNTDGKLGDGTTTNQSIPTSVLGNKKWISLSGGGDFTIGVDEDGKLWAWGDDSLGQLGDG